MHLPRFRALFLLAFVIFFGAVAKAQTAAASDATYLDNARANLPKLRAQVLQTLDESRHNNPQVFQTVAQAIAGGVDNFLKSDLRPIDMSGVVQAKYATYNMDIWRYRSVSESLNQLALAYSVPESPLYNKPEVLAKAAQGFEWLLSVTSPEGTCQAPDSNLDRFAYTSYWDAFVLFAPALAPDLRDRFLKMMLAAGDYQLKTFGTRPFPGGGGYPNMDAAYMLTMEESTLLFGKSDYTADLDHRIELLRQRLTGGAWEYMAGWNPQPGYTRVTLEWAGRLYQLSGKPELLKQIQAHAAYYENFLEPCGLLDFGMVPFIKHDWVREPFGACATTLDLVNRYNPTPILQDEVDQLRAKAVQSPNLFASPRLLYWISADSGQRQAPPTAFIRASPEDGGFEARTTTPAGTLTVYGTAKETAVDTRVSAIVSGPAGKGTAALAGAFLELIQNGASYYLGDMKPKADLQVSDTAATLTVTQKRHMMGPLSKPLVFGNHHDDIKNWKFDCWKGGSPDGPPIETVEKWSWNGQHLTGDITLTAQADTQLDGVQLSLPTLLAQPEESKAIAEGNAVRYGHLCLLVRGKGEAWKAVNQGTPYDFRADVPAGDYTVTLVAGDTDFPTDPFDILANGKKVDGAVTAPQGKTAEKSFPVTAADGSIRLKFMPEKGDTHWKVVSLAIASSDGKYAKKFAVGNGKAPQAADVAVIAGADVYTPQRSYGWSHDLSGAERHRGATTGPTDLITSPASGGTMALEITTPEKWPKGKTASLQVVVGIGDALGPWIKSDGAPDLVTQSP